MTTLRAAGAGLVSAEQLARMPLDYPCELVGGRIVRMSPAGGWHGLVCGRVQDALSAHVNANALGRVLSGETGYLVRSDPDTVRAPDVAFVAEARVAQARVAGYPDLAPDLVVEVVSPHDAAGDVQARVEDWLRAGTRLVWVLYPQSRSAVVYRPDGEARVLHADDTLAGDPALPGFACRVGELF